MLKSNYLLKLLEIYALEKTVPCIEVDKHEEGEEKEQEITRKKSQPKEFIKKFALLCFPLSWQHVFINTFYAMS